MYENQEKEVAEKDLRPEAVDKKEADQEVKEKVEKE